MTVCTNVLKTTHEEHKNSNWVRPCVKRVLDRLVTVLGLVLVVLGCVYGSPLKHRTLPALPVSPSRALLKGSTTKHLKTGFNTV